MTLSGIPQAARRRGLAATAAALVAGAVLAPAAAAGVVETPNACKFTYDDEYRTQGVELTATAPAEAAAGQAFTLAGEELEVKLRPLLASDAAQAGLIPSSPGGTPSTIATKTWLAIRATNTSEGTQVVGPITISATTTAYYDDAAQAITATPFAYTPPKLPDTAWTATGGDIAFSQAGPGAITAAKGQLPVGPSGSGATVAGSAVIQANLPNDVNFYMDCQPGETIVTRPPAGAGVSFTPLVAAPFASVAVAGVASNPGGVPPKLPAATGTARTALSGRIVSRTLVAKRGRVAVRISCAAGGPECAGNALLRTRTPVRIGRRKPALLNLARTLAYNVPAGRSRTVTLVLSANAKTLLRRRGNHKVRLTLKPAKGRSTARNLTLRRG
jgi:hypothetical protein